MYPRITVEGGPRERGRQYGEAARERVERSVEAYREVFAHYAGWDWARVREEAAGFRAPIEAHGSKPMEEIRGIAEGAGVDELDVLAINVRTEVMFSATARDADGGDVKRLPPECSSFAALPARTGGRTLAGQNCDWLVHSSATTVVLEAHQDEGPDFVTVVEAGLLAKAGMSSSGIALCTNALVTDADRGRPGVPYHVLLRSILDAETISDALVTILRAERSSSANFLLVDEDGVALDVEAAPGDFSRAFLVYPERGLLLHTNHFLSPRFDGRDVSLWAMPDSPFRLARLREIVAEREEPLDVEALAGVLADHATHPLGVCCHPDPRLAEVEQAATVASVIMEPAARRMWVADGNPCTAEWEELDLSDALAKGSRLRAPAAA